MNFKNLFLSFFFVLAVGLALVHAEEAQPRGPKITSKVCIDVIFGTYNHCELLSKYDILTVFTYRCSLISSTETSLWAESCLACMARLSLRYVIVVMLLSLGAPRLIILLLLF